MSGKEEPVGCKKRLKNDLKISLLQKVGTCVKLLHMGVVAV
jgi:hypothetical protein